MLCHMLRDDDEGDDADSGVSCREWDRLAMARTHVMDLQSQD